MTSLSRKVRLVVRLLWIVVIVQPFLFAGIFWLDAISRAPDHRWTFTFLFAEIVSYLALLSSPAVGALLLWKQRENRIGWLFCLSSFGWGINNLAGDWALYTHVTHPGALPFANLSVWLYFWPGLLSTCILILLILLYPTGHALTRRWNWVVRATVLIAVVAAVLTMLAPGTEDSSIGFTVVNPYGLGGAIGHIVRVISGPSELLLTLLLMLAAISLVLRAIRSRGIERQQIKWAGLWIGIAGVIVSIEFVLNIIYSNQSAMPLWAKAVTTLSQDIFSLLPIAAGMAILRYRLYDIDRIINRALVYTAMTASLAGVYIGGVLLLQYLLSPLTRQSDLAIALSTLAVAALFQPLRHRFQRLVDRRFYRQRYDATRILATFGTSARDEMDLEHLCGALVQVIGETIQPEHVSLWIRTTHSTQGEP